MNGRKCSKEHVVSSLNRLRVLTRFISDVKEFAELEGAWGEELTGYEPQVVTEACERWAREKKGWPHFSELIAFCEEQARPRQPPPPFALDGREGYANRLKRLGISHEAMMGQFERARPVFAAHCENRISDEEIVAAFAALDGGKPLPRLRPASEAVGLGW